MKKFTVLIVMLLLCVGNLFAQMPEKFNYQAVVRNASNALVANAPVGVRVSILEGGADGNVAYVEKHTATTNVNGLLTIEIGGGLVLQGSFASIKWDLGQLFLKTEIDPAGADNYTIISTQQLLSVPYALFAKEAGNGFSGNYNDLTNKPTIPQNLGDLTNDAGYVTIDDIASATQIQSDWAQTDISAVDFIKNKPTIPDDNNLVHLTGNETITGDKTVTSDFSLKNIGSGGNVTPYLTFQRGTITDSYVDWKINNESGKLQFFYSTSGTDTKMFDINSTRAKFANKVEATQFVRTGGTSSQFLKADGSVDTNTYLTHHQDISGKANTADLAMVAFSGDYNDLTNKPTISDGGGGILIETDPIFSAWNKDYNDLTNKPNFAPVAISGNYNDLTNKPDIPNDNNLVHLTGNETISGGKTFTENFSLKNTGSGGNGTPFFTFQRGTPTDSYVDWKINNDGGKLQFFYSTSGTDTKQFDINNARAKFANKVEAAQFVRTDGTSSQFLKADGSVDNNTYLTQQDISGKANTADLATVAFSGSYDDLSNKPTIPAAQVNSDWNATSGKAQILNKPNLSPVATSGSYNDLINKPINLSQFVNDVGFITAIPDSLGGISIESDPLFTAWDKDYNDLINKPDIPNDNNLVHLTGNETISGGKTFTENFSLKNAESGGNVTPFLTFQRGTLTDSYVDWKINNEGGKLQFFYSTSGTDTKQFDINSTRAKFANKVEASQFVRTGGTSSQFLKADGSVDNNTYLTQQDISGKANTADLATVAFSGSYNDLANTPTIPAAQVNSDWNATSGLAKILNKPTLATVATSGDYNDLTNKPTIPSDNTLVHIAGDETITGSKTATSDFSLKNTGSAGNGTPFLTFQRGTLTDSYVDWKINNDGGKLQFFYSSSGTDTKLFDINNTRAKFANKVEAAQFVKTGGTSSQFLKADGSVDNNTYLTQQDISGKANTADLASVAFSGNYNDLTNTPTIPTVNNATLTIKQNGTSLGTFTANQSTNKTINITTLTADDVQAMINDALSEMQQQMDSLKDELSSVQDALSVMPQYYMVPSTGSKSITLDNSVTHVDVYDWGGPDGNYGNYWDGSLTLVTRDANKVFKITGSYSIEGNGGYDYLNLYNGTVPESNTIVHLASSGSTLTIPDPIYSAGDTITIRFKSDQSIAYSGFALSIDIVSKPACTSAKAVDYKGNYYNTVQIGNQCWMKENLRTDYYADGTYISTSSSSSSTTSSCRYDYSSSSLTLEQRGYLYNWPAVMHGESSSNANPSGVQGICPSGWHVPSDAEWVQLKNYVGSIPDYQCSGNSSYIASALASTTEWRSSNQYYCCPGNTNSSNNATDFSAFPAGYWNNGFYKSGEETDFWTSTQDSNLAKCHFIWHDDNFLYATSHNQSYGHSVRCVRNE